MSPTEETKDTVIVRFDKSVGVYQAGERASFSWDRARKMVKNKVAHYDDPDLKKKPGPLDVKDEDESGNQDEDVRSHGKSIEQVKAIIDSIDDLDELERIWAGEIENPQHPKGRKGVLEACRSRAAEIKEATAGDDG